jgi:hypothetical protein
MEVVATHVQLVLYKVLWLEEQLLELQLLWLEVQLVQVVWWSLPLQR